MTVKNFKVKNGLTVGTGATIYGNGNIDVAGIITAATFKGDGSGLINVTALGTGIQINNNGSIIGIGSIINFGTNIAVSPVFAGITTITGSTNPIPGISTTGTSFFNGLQVGAAATFSGEVEVADYIRHKGDTNTAIRFPTDDTFSVVTGSLERFRVESDGEIGIGTEDPRAKLDVDGTIYSAGNIKLYDNVKAEFGDSADLKIYHNPSTSPDTNTIVSGSGQILELQTDKFRVVDFGATKDLIAADDGGSATLFYDGDVRLKTTGTGVDISDTLNVAGVSTFTGNSTFDGQIGIGTDVPDEILHLGQLGTAGNNYNEGRLKIGGFPGTDKGLLIGYDNRGSGRGNIVNANNSGGAANRINIGFGAITASGAPTTEVVTINQLGNIGFGTGTPRAKFDVRPGGHSGDGAITFTTGLGEVGSSNNAIQSINGVGSALQPLGYRATEHIFATQAAERLRISSGGNVSIGGSVSIGGTSTFNGNVGISSALFDKDGDKGSSGQVLSSTGTQVNWINVGNISAGAASSIAITANNTTNETVYPIFTDGNSGNRGAEVDTGLTYNPSTGVLTATQFTGALSGNAGSATQLQTARNIGGVSFNGTANIDLPGVNTAGNQNTSGTAAGLSGTPDITVDEIGTRNINVSGVTTTAAVNWGGHMLPTSNAAYDIGSAELKVRHLFLSDNSLKFVDSSDTEHPLSLDNGNLKFGKGLFLGTTIKADAASGIVTATTFKGALDGNAGTATVATNAQGLTGTPNITIGVLNASSGTVSGNLDVQGTLTYVNVDNVTSTGIGTFKKGIQIHGDGLDVVGIATFGTGIGVTGNITVTGNVDGRDINADGTKLDTIATSANNYTHPNHTGDVTSTGDGATVIADDAVTYAKMQNVSATDRILGRDSAGAGVVEEITPANLRTMINVADGANAYTHPNHTGEVTSTGDGATVIASNIVDEDNLKISNTGTNGQFLSKQSGNTGGLTWATPTNTTYSLVDTNDDGLAPQLPAAHGGKFLKADATWEVPPNTEYGVVSTSADGLAPQLPASHGGKFLKADGSWEVPAYITNTNDYVNSLSFATGTGVLTLGRTGSLGNLTVDLDGRYLQSHGLTFGAGLQLDGSAVSSTAAREQNITWTATVGTAVDMWTIAHNTADTFEITIYAKSGSHKQAQKMLVMHDGTTAHHNQYAVMYTSSARLYDFTATISGTNLKIQVTPLTGADTSTNGSNVHWRYAVLGNSGN